MDYLTVQAIVLTVSYSIAISLRAAGLVDNVFETTTAAYCVILPPSSLALRDNPVISALLDDAGLDPTRTPTAPPIALNFKAISMPDRVDVRISPLGRRLLISEDELEQALLAKQRNDYAARIADEVATAWSSYEERLISGRPSATKDAPWLQASPLGLASYILALIVLIMTVVVIYVRLFRRKPTRRFAATKVEIESGAPPAPPPSTTVDDEVNTDEQEINDLLAEFPGPAFFEERVPYVEILPVPAAVPAAPAPVTPAPIAPAPTAPAPVAPAPTASAPIVQAPVAPAPVAPAPAAPAAVAPAAAVPAPVVVPSVPLPTPQNQPVQSDEDDDEEEDDADDIPLNPPQVLDSSSTSSPSVSEASNDLADDPLPFAHDDCLFATDANEPALPDSGPVNTTNPVPCPASPVTDHDEIAVVKLPSQPTETSHPVQSIQPTPPLPEASVIPLNSAHPEVDVTFQVASTDYGNFDIVDETSTPVVNLPRAHREEETDVGLSPAPPCVTEFDDAALQPSSVGDSLFSFFDETSPSAPIVNLPRTIQANEDDAGPSPVPQDVAAPSDDDADLSSDESEAENIDAHEMVSRIRGMFSLRLGNDSRHRQATRILVPIAANPTASQDTDSTISSASSPQLQTPPDLPVEGPAPLAATNEQLAQMLDNLRSKPAPSSTAPSIERSPLPIEEHAPSAETQSLNGPSHLDFLTARLVQSAASMATRSNERVNLIATFFPDLRPIDDAVVSEVRGQEQETSSTAEDDQRPVQALDSTEPRESGAEEEEVVNVHVPDEEQANSAPIEAAPSVAEPPAPLDEGAAPFTLSVAHRDFRHLQEGPQDVPQGGEILYIAVPQASVGRVTPQQEHPQAPAIHHTPHHTPQQTRSPAPVIRIVPPTPPLECPRYRCTSPSSVEVPNDGPPAVNFVWFQAPPYGIMRDSQPDGLNELSQALGTATTRIEASALTVEAPAAAVATYPRIDDLQESDAASSSEIEMPVHSADELPETTPAVAESHDDTPALPLPNATPSEGICTETSSPAEHDLPEPVPTSSETSTPAAPTTTTSPPAHERRKTHRVKGVKIVLQSNGPRNLGR
ncbi:hypothetical protein K523DRAFT_277180 [Schizophyllum commune Tattone D]|nr:hypothetical protein K523DRAFT_277180 [Schizophyllum commune Tattone D]